VLVLSGFIRPHALAAMQMETIAAQDQAYFCTQSHSVSLAPPDPGRPDGHLVNRQVTSSKGCICDDVVDATSPLRALCNDAAFRIFVLPRPPGQSCIAMPTRCRRSPSAMPGAGRKWGGISTIRPERSRF